MATHSEPKSLPLKFESVQQGEVPMSRDGEHKEIVAHLLSEIAELEDS